MEIRRYRIIVKGIVQGVGYRYFALQQAKKYEVKGWVKNRCDGYVEIVCEGIDERLKLFVERLREGPYSARVEDLEIKKEEYRGEFLDFEIKF